MNMTVNGTAISVYGATLLSANYGYSKVTTYNDWLRGAKNPLYYGQDVTYTSAKFTILIEGSNLADTDKNCSDLYSAMQKSIVKVSGADWSVDGHVVSASDSNRISPLAREVEIEFEGVKIADRTNLIQTMTFGSPYTFTVKGNTEVPCRIQFTIDRAYLSFRFTLNGEVYEIKNIGSSDSSLVIDSEQGLVLLDGNNKIGDYEAWKLPILKPGENSLSVTSGAPTVRIGYNGRWI